MLAAIVATASCAAPVTLDPAPFASDPQCAEVLRDLPAELAGAERRSTTTQASRAWGEPPIHLRCGVDPPGPTTERCITVTTAAGLGIDWVVAEFDDADGATGRGQFAFTTYGRAPAIEVVVPVEYAGSDATALLLDLAPAVSQIEQSRRCIGFDDL